MVELNYKTIFGVLLLVIVTSSGTYYLEKTTQYKSCQGQWLLLDSGQYQCSKNGNLQWCYSIEKRGSGWVRCWVGKQVVVTEPSVNNQPASKLFCNGEWWDVSANPNVYTKIKNGDSEMYYGEC